MRMMIKILNPIIDNILIRWFYIVNSVCRGWWVGMQNTWINIFIYVGTLALFSAVPFRIFQEFRSLGLQLYLLVIMVFLVSIPFAILINLDKWIKVKDIKEDV